jgi:hypothetical protein
MGRLTIPTDRHPGESRDLNVFAPAVKEREIPAFAGMTGRESADLA